MIMIKPKQRFFELAKRCSMKSNHHKCMVGCVIVYKKTVVSFGFNSNRTHPRSKSYSQTLHAELDALIGLSYDQLKHCTAYVYREYKTGGMAMSKPCGMCEHALRMSGIKDVFYTVENGWAYEKY